MVRQVKKGNISLIIISIFAVLMVLLIFIKVPFSTSPFSDSNAVCINGEVKIKSSGDYLSNIIRGKIADLSEMRDDLICSIELGGSFSYTYEIKCVDNVPTMICRSNLWRVLINGKTPLFISTDKLGVPYLKGLTDIEVCNALCSESCSTFQIDNGVLYVECSNGDKFSYDPISEKIGETKAKIDEDYESICIQNCEEQGATGLDLSFYEVGYRYSDTRDVPRLTCSCNNGKLYNHPLNP